MKVKIKKHSQTEETIAISPIQQRFIDYYIIEKTGKDAAIKAGYSPKTAVSKASQLLKKQHIKDAILEQKKELRAQFCLEKYDIVKEYLEMIEYAKSITEEDKVTSEPLWIQATANLAKITGLDTNIVEEQFNNLFEIIYNDDNTE